MHHAISISELKLDLQSGNAKFGSKSAIFFVPCDLEISWMSLKNNRAPLLCYVKRCASCRSHRWLETGVIVEKRPIQVNNCNFFVTCDLEIWRMTLKNNRAPLPYYVKLCASFHGHMWIQNWSYVWKRLNCFFYLCDLDLWPLTSTCCTCITSVNVNNPWKFHDDTMKGT